MINVKGGTKQMPSNYAHYHFGQAVRKTMPDYLLQRVKGDGGLFDIGQHGPDILFYYMAISRNSVNTVGYEAHDKTGVQFFTSAAEAIAASEHPAAMTAYALGVVCHFVLDSACHGYVEKKIQVSGVPHSDIEVEFDRYLMEQDGLDPLRHRLTGHIQPTTGASAAIAPFYPPVKPEEVLHALWAMKFYDRLLTGPSCIKRGLINTGLRITGNYESMHGMMIQKTPLSACRDSNLRLDKLLNRSIPTAVTAMENFLAFCQGRETLGGLFQRTFGAGSDWSEIPVLSYEEEVQYEI